jgi:hypothetical protein
MLGGWPRPCPPAADGDAIAIDQRVFGRKARDLTATSRS